MKTALYGAFSELTLSQKSLVITCAVMFASAVSTLIIDLDDFYSITKPPETPEDKEVIVEISPEQFLTGNMGDPNVENEDTKKKKEGYEMQIDTHSAFNQNDKEQEGLDEDITSLEDITETLIKSHDYITSDDPSATESILDLSKKKKEETEDLLDDISKSIKKINNSRSTVRYTLEGREVIAAPTPAYTCENRGIVVVNITVGRSGYVINATIDRERSSQEDGCLEKNALDYAMRALFSVSSSSENQQGSITFLYMD